MLERKIKIQECNLYNYKYCMECLATNLLYVMGWVGQPYSPPGGLLGVLGSVSGRVGIRGVAAIA